MKLKEWLDKNAMPQAAFARAINEFPQTVCRYVNGDRMPEEEIMLKIFSATKGQVTANDFYNLPENIKSITA